MTYRRTGTIAGRGDAADQFSSALRGIAIDSKDMLYAVGDGCVKVFQTDGKFQRTWPTARPGVSIAVRSDGAVFVGQEGQIEVFDAEGRRTALWSDAERLGLVTAIAFAKDDVIAADAKACCLRRFDAAGNFRNDIGAAPERRSFLIPNGVLDLAIDGAGVIHAANPGKHRIERFSLDGERLGHVGRFDGRDPAGFPGCCNPTNITLARDGTIFVTEKANPRAKVYAADGSLLAVISDNDFDLNCKNMDVAVDSAGNVYVVDTVALHVCVFAPQTASTAGPSSRPSAP